MSLFNSMSAMIIHEGSKCETCKCDSVECDQMCQDFDDTLSGLDTADMTYTIDSLPVLKDECGECGTTECGESCGESYMIEYDILTKLIESYNDIRDEFDAHQAICEHYCLDPDQLKVVVECDNINKGLLNKAKCSGDCSLINSYCGSIKNMINKGIVVVKKK